MMPVGNVRNSSCSSGRTAPSIWPGRCRVLFLLLAAVVLSACGRGEGEFYPEYTARPRSGIPVYHFGVYPLHNPQRLHEIYGPLLDYLNSRLSGFRLELEASRSYEEYERKLYNRHFQFALPNPYQTVEALSHGYRVFGKMGDDGEFRGIILVRRDSGIRHVKDLKGKTVGFPAPTALAATMMPLYYLHTHGIDANRDITRLFTGSQESSIMSVYLGSCAAAASWPIPWKVLKKRSPQVARELMVKWETPSLVNNSLIVRDDVPADIADKVASVLFDLQRHRQGRHLLARIPISRFEPASEASYQPVREFLERYRKSVR